MHVTYATGILAAAVRKTNVAAASGLSAGREEQEQYEDHFAAVQRRQYCTIELHKALACLPDKIEGKGIFR
jgi:hypothetical protein